MTTAAATVASLRASDRVKALAPSRPDGIDAAFVMALGLLAMLGFWSTFDSPVYLVPGLVGLLLGVAIAHLAIVLRQPLVLLAVLVIVAYFLVGGAFAVRESALGGVLPTPAVVGTLSEVAIGGWKDLITTLPPVDARSSLVALPYLLGLLGGAIGFTLARKTRGPAWALLPMAAMVALVILLGTLHPTFPLVLGLGWAVVAVLWLVIRSQRRLVQIATSASNGRAVRLATGTILVVLAGLAASLLSGLLPGADARERFVLRSVVEPPFDPAVYASPAASFRRFTQGAKVLWDQPLLSVSGLPKGARLRFATMDDYNGTVWSAQGPAFGGKGANGYQRVGSVIEQGGIAAPVTYTVTVEPAYAAVSALNPWLPAAGAISTVEFSEATRAEHLATFRYNLTANQGIVPDRLRAGDTLTITGAQLEAASESTQVAADALTSAGEFLAPQATKWAAGQSDRWKQVLAIANHLKASGAYSDGTAAAEARYLPGHSLGRLSAFVNAKQLVGNDEQYAATFALMANQVGVPTRVILGAVVPEDGKVKGENVHVWAEVRTADGSWVTVPETTFMPPRDKKPDQLQDDPVQDRNAAQVPPPQAAKPPASADLLFDTDAGAIRPGRTSEEGFILPAWVMTTLRIAGIPVTAVLGFVVIVLVAKAVRRRRRKSRGTATTRLASGWREVVDRAVDFGVSPAAGATRREQGRALESLGVATLADRADAGVFGAGDPEEADVAAYWADVESARKQMVAGRSRWQRVRGAVSLRSFAVAAPKVSELAPRRLAGRMPRSPRMSIPKLSKAPGS
ncbi:MAG: transglutaminase domain-containing protein [Actinomycetales bacterium]|nr:transglutaminase domain-containing protein [Actinomycetales bacterium]